MILKLKQSALGGGIMAAICQPFKIRAEFLLSIQPNVMCKNIVDCITASMSNSRAFDDPMSSLITTDPYTTQYKTDSSTYDPTYKHTYEHTTERTYERTSQLNTHYVNLSHMTELDMSLHMDCMKQANDVSKFLTCNIKDIRPLRYRMKAMSFKALSRIAGFKAMMLLYSKQDDVPKGMKGPFPALISACLQPAVLEHLVSSFYSLQAGKTEGTTIVKGAHVADPSDSPVKTTDGSASHTPSSISYRCEDGHYTIGLKAVNSTILSELSRSFEGLYSFIAQLLQRSAWGSQRSIQAVALACWGISVDVEDHLFLNRIGIFRILHSVLEDTRSSAEWVQAMVADAAAAAGGKGSESTVTIVDRYAQYSREMLLQQDKKLAYLVIKIVHSLASQVAYSIDAKSLSPYSKLSAIQLQRMPSGPDTLSQSLFEMLYSELFYTLRDRLVNPPTAAASSPGQDKQPLILKSLLPMSPEAAFASAAPSPLQDSQLKGDEYIYRILRLLDSVSGSTICQKSLSTSKWVTLLLMLVGVGNLLIQRRLFRLLRTLILAVPPSAFKAYIPSSFDNWGEYVIDSDKPFDDDDIDSFIMGESTANKSINNISAASLQLVDFLVLGMSLIYPVQTTAAGNNKGEVSKLQTIAEGKSEGTTGHAKYVKNLFDCGISHCLKSECLYTLRYLLESASWRSVVDLALRDSLQRGLDYMTHQKPNESVDDAVLNHQLAHPTAALAVLGAFVDKIDVGSLVAIKVSSLTEAVASRLAQVSTHGIVISVSGANIEMICVQPCPVSLHDSDTTTAAASGTVRRDINWVPVTPTTLVRLTINDVRAESLITYTGSDISLPTFDVLLSCLSQSVHVATRLQLKRDDAIHSTSGKARRKEAIETAEELHEMEIDEDEDRDDDDGEHDDPNEDHDDYDDEEGYEEREERDEMMAQEEVFDDEDMDENEEFEQHLLRQSSSHSAASQHSTGSGKPPHPRTASIGSSIGDTEEGSKIAPVNNDKHVLQLKYQASVFRSVWSSLQNESFVNRFIQNTPISTSTTARTQKDMHILSHILSLAVSHPQSGTLAVLEDIEDRWVGMWNELCSQEHTVPTTGAPTPSKRTLYEKEPVPSQPPPSRAQESVPSLRSIMRMERESASQTASIGTGGRASYRRNNILETAARAGLFPSLLSGALSTAPSAAEIVGMVSQMTDMGLPKEWAEAALRRCRYNVEMAINMCFEGGVDMEQLVTDDVSWLFSFYLFINHLFMLTFLLLSYSLLRGKPLHPPQCLQLPPHEPMPSARTHSPI